MKNILMFLKNKSVIGGIAMVLFYQVVMILIFMTGYSAIPKNMTEMSVAIVNEDKQAGKEIAAGLAKQLPFKMVTDLPLDKAQEQLNDRELALVIHIPQDFTKQLSTSGTKAKMDFFMNQSNPAMVSSSMQSVVTQITTNLNTQFATQTAQGVFQSMKMPAEQAQKLAAEIPTKLDANIVNTNPVPAGMHNQMAPFFLTMVSYTGAMIFSMMMVGAMNALKRKMGLWQAFWSAQATNAIVALIAPLIGISIYFLIQGGHGAEVFVKVWLVHALELFGAIEFMSIFSLLLKDKAIFVNLTLMLIQTISSGATMSREMMPWLFKIVSYISIMFYTVQTDFSIIFGGGKLTEHLLGLWIAAIASMIICMVSFYFVSPKEAADDIEKTVAA
ncbi:hypothetical protein P4H66_20480 [Paenibacillus dokdonensis]|uniref:ABC-2 type transporter transmembrane domain-containing protein n=1 Tax=Paenibacillus dokdonensis TaxID=2567944 RepID=A0ABU6GTZ3_9BACL|nr:ABC transporter permease [Paenibacillus dokdonensis]MEC0242185.1 hypothetical protein [Paenibacillus dokdonensis]